MQRALLLFGKLGVVGNVVKVNANIIARYHIARVALPWYPEGGERRQRAKVIHIHVCNCYTVQLWIFQIFIIVHVLYFVLVS